MPKKKSSLAVAEAPAKPKQANGKPPSKAWSGALQFGLISVPVILFTAAREEVISFHHYHAQCLGRLKQLGNFCPVCTGAPEPDALDPDVPIGKIRLDSSEVLKGFEYSNGDIVPISNEDIDSVRPDSAKVLQILSFCKSSDIDPVFFESSFFVSPDTGGLRTYAVFREALIKNDVVAVGKVTKSKREHMVLIRPYHDGLMCFTSYMSDEIRSMIFPDLPASKPEEIKVASQLIAAMTEPWQPEQYNDEYRSNLLALIESKHGKTPLPEIIHKPVQKVSDDPLSAFSASLALLQEQKKIRKTA